MFEDFYDEGDLAATHTSICYQLDLDERYLFLLAPLLFTDTLSRRRRKLGHSAAEATVMAAAVETHSFRPLSGAMACDSFDTRQTASPAGPRSANQSVKVPR